MAELKFCESCGRPMKAASEHGGGNINNPYCVHCTTADGKLKSREEIRRWMIRLYMSQGKTRDEAEKIVDKHMTRMPAWRV